MMLPGQGNAVPNEEETWAEEGQECSLGREECAMVLD